MEEIFKMLKIDSNDYLSKMKGTDLQELFYYLKRYKIGLRDTINIDKDITFGLEIECENALTNKLNPLLEKEYQEWKIVKDSTVTCNKGEEIVSPILNDTKDAWINLNNICHLINTYAEILTNSAGHIHIGTQILGSNREAWINFIRLWAVYENIIFRFSSGEFTRPRDFIDNYAHPLNDFYLILLKHISKRTSLIDIIERTDLGKYYAVNTGHVFRTRTDEFLIDNTIEFRIPNGTLNPIIWQNNVNLFTKLLLYCKSNNYNLDIILKRLKNTNIEYKYYNEIYLEQALEFSDLIFNNNLDKINFLKQYLRSFKVNDEYKREKRITK